jgi:O-antigen ligase
LLLALFLPVWPRIVPVIVTALALNWIASGNVIELIRENKSPNFFILFIALYVFYGVGLLYTTNLNSGLKEIMTKLSLLIFPVLFFSLPSFDGEQFKKIIKSFVYGCLIAALICLAQASYNYITTKYAIAHGSKDWDFGINYFLKDRISIWMHPSYRAMYFVMALVFLSFYKKDFVSLGIWRFFFSFILALLVVLFSSKAGIIGLLLLGIYVGFQMVFREKKIKQVIIGVLASVIIFFSLYFSAPQFALRIDDAWKAVSGNVDVKKSDESTAARMAIWSASKKIIGENIWTGVGTGAVEDVLVNEYEKEGMTTAHDEHLNSHNQFLQTFIGLGIAGFIILMLSLFLPLIAAWKNKNFLYVFFILLFIINILVESMFETQAGVIFYAFMNSFLFSVNFKKADE